MANQDTIKKVVGAMGVYTNTNSKTHEQTGQELSMSNLSIATDELKLELKMGAINELALSRTAGGITDKKLDPRDSMMLQAHKTLAA